MAEDRGQFPKRNAEAGLEVRHRAGMGGKTEAKPLQVERMVKKESDLNRTSRRSRRHRSQQEAGPWKLGVIILAGVTVIGVVVFSLWYTMTRNRAPVTVDPVVERPEQPEVQVSSFITTATPAEIAEAIETTVREFMNAESFEERCRWVRGGQAMREQMEEFYSREGQELPGRFGKIIDRSPLAFGGVPVEVVTATEEGGDQTQVFSMLPGRDRMLIDWESAVAYGQLSWGELLEQRPLEPVQMRVFVKLDTYYNYEFADERKWQSLRIKTRFASEMLYAYIERGSPVAEDVLAKVGPGRIVPMNLRLKFLPEARQRDMVVIDELIHPLWLSDEGLESSLETED